jgi:hypothetical protein
MPSIHISQAAYEKLSFAAELAELDMADTLDRLVGVKTAPPPAPPGTDEIAVHKTYAGHLLKGVLNLNTERLRLTEAPHSELVKEYPSPSGAASTAIHKLNPAVPGNTNGWRHFWKCDCCGKPIEQHRRRP